MPAGPIKLAKRSVDVEYLSIVGRHHAEGGFDVSVIVAYKLVKSGVEIVLGGLLLGFGSVDVADYLRVVAKAFEHHATEAWSLALAARFASAITAPRLLVIAWASLCDGVVSAFEGLALHRRYTWSRWLIVVATACALPFEIVALFRHANIGRFALLVANAAIVVYLVRRRIENRPAGCTVPALTKEH